MHKLALDCVFIKIKIETIQHVLIYLYNLNIVIHIFMDVIFLIRNMCRVVRHVYPRLALCTKEHNSHLITYKLSNNRDLMEKMHNKYYLFLFISKLNIR